MRIHRLDAETVALEEIDDFCLAMLQQIPASADPSGSEAAQQRLYPSLTGGVEPAADEEWREFVQPDLQQLFFDAVKVVEEDLKQIDSAADSRDRKLPVRTRNLEAWVHALNQARLAISARYGFDENERDREFATEHEDRARAALQMHFYGLLEEYLLEQLD